MIGTVLEAEVAEGKEVVVRYHVGGGDGREGKEEL